MTRRNMELVSRLRDVARDAVDGATINNIDTRRNALREYFAPRKTRTHTIAPKFREYVCVETRR